MQLKNKIALITGASAGIGRACAEVFAEAGARLILIARRKESIVKLAEELKEKFSTDCMVFCEDVRDYDSLKLKLDNLPDDWKPIDILVNNAGLARGLHKIHEGVLSDWEEMIDTNIKGLLYVSRIVLPGMIERDSGIVINIGSIAGRETYPMGAVYCGTKHAVVAISQGMVIDLNGTGVRVTNLEPGLVETEFALVRFHGDDEKAANIYQGYTPLQAIDIADVALFIATRPPHVLIQDILITPTDQATTTILNKK